MRTSSGLAGIWLISVSLWGNLIIWKGISETLHKTVSNTTSVICKLSFLPQGDCLTFSKHLISFELQHCGTLVQSLIANRRDHTPIILSPKMSQIEIIL